MNSIQLSIHSMTGFMQLDDSNLNVCGCFTFKAIVLFNYLHLVQYVYLFFSVLKPSTTSYTSWHSIHDIASYFKKKTQTVKREKPHTLKIMSIYLTAFGLYILDAFLCSHLRPPELIFFTYTNVSSLHITAKSLQSCPTLCNPIDGSPPGCPIPNPKNLPPLSLHLQIFPC